MTDSLLFHDGNRALQDQFHSRPIADRLEAVTMHTRFTEGDKAFIESAIYFFLATADAGGRPDVDGSDEPPPTPVRPQCGFLQHWYATRLFH